MAGFVSKYLDPYENLANGIILQAVEDYRKALKKLSKNSRNKDAEAEAASIEQFFRSEWFEMLTDVDGQYLIRRIGEEFPDLKRERSTV